MTATFLDFSQNPAIFTNAKTISDDLLWCHLKSPKRCAQNNIDIVEIFWHELIQALAALLISTDNKIRMFPDHDQLNKWSEDWNRYISLKYSLLSFKRMGWFFHQCALNIPFIWQNPGTIPCTGCLLLLGPPKSSKFELGSPKKSVEKLKYWNWTCHNRTHP